MPIELGIWKIDGSLSRVSSSRLKDERKLEEMIEQDISLVDADLLVIGRQVKTDFGKFIDLLAMTAEGELVVIELKRNRAPREVVAQVLDYASWVKDLAHDQVIEVFHDYVHRSDSFPKETRFEQAFTEKFGDNPPEALNEGHSLIVVASELDESTERIIAYLSQEHGVPINAVLFQHFVDEEREYLTRTWLRDPREVEAAASWSRKSKREPWNGHDYYVSFGEDQQRSWDDAIRYGFISAGGGRWYSRTLEMLEPDNRVFVCIPKTGYVGVGTVIDSSVPVDEFEVEVDGGAVPILSAPLQASGMGEDAGDPEKTEYLVRVAWQKTVPKEQAIWDKGMFANQNSACRLRNQFTLDRLIQRFGLEE